MATDLNVGPWATKEEAMEAGGKAVKAAARELDGSVHGWAAVERPSDGQWGVRGCFSTTKRDRRGRKSSDLHYVKAGIDWSCGHPKRYS